MRIVNKKRFFLSNLVMIFLLITLFNVSFAKDTETDREIITYTICKGDTLWNIAKQYTPNNKDIRQTIYEIEKLNNLDNATIYAGQTIKIKK